MLLMQDVNYMENPCKIIFFGGSITREVAPIFEKKIRTRHPEYHIKIVNAGVMGEASRDGIKRLNKIIKESPDVVVIDFGMDDAAKNVPKNEFRDNLCTMIEKLGNIDARVTLTTIMFDDSSPLIKQYNCVIRELARKKRLKIADVNSLWKRKTKHYRRVLGDKSWRPYETYCESLMNVVPQSHTVILWQYNGRECKCNYRCPYCYYARLPKAENFFFGTIEQWHDVFKKSFGNQRLFFYLAFGEPTLGEAFYDVVKMIESEPKWKLRITTNLSQPLERLMKTKLVKEGRLFINASFHPTQTNVADFLKQLFYLRKHGIEAPVIYVMWPPQMKRFESDFKVFNEHNFLVHVRRFEGTYKGKQYPRAYTEEERQFIARYCDDATIIYMLNEKPAFDKHTYSGFHFFIVDCVGNIGYDSDCFSLHTKYRTIFGNIIQHETLNIPLEPTPYPRGYTEGTVDGVSNYLELGYQQLEGNNVLSFAKQGGVYKTPNGVFYKNLNKNFNDSRIRAEYYFPCRNIKDLLIKIKYWGIKNYGLCMLRTWYHRLKKFIIDLL